MDTLTRRADRAIWVGLGGIGLGLATLLIIAWVEYLNTPDISLVDGYLIGREPWTSIGIWLVIAGATVSLAAAALANAVRGDWLRRVLMLPALALPILWWATAVGLIPLPRYTPTDPSTLAYSMPETAAVALILPAVAAAFLAFMPIPPDRQAQFRPVHAEGRTGDKRPQ